MASNQLLSDGRYVKLPVGAGVESGDPVLVSGITGVATADADANEEAVVDRGGSYKLNVLGANGQGNVQVSIGDLLYISAQNALSLINSGVTFGYALAIVTSGETEEIEVLLK